MVGWIMAITVDETRSHASKSIFTGRRPRLGGCCMCKMRELVPTIFDRDATDNDIVVNVAKAYCNVNNVGAPHLCDKQERSLSLTEHCACRTLVSN